MNYSHLIFSILHISSRFVATVIMIYHAAINYKVVKSKFNNKIVRFPRCI